MENPIKMDDLGGFTPIFGNTQMEVTNNPWKAHFWVQSRSRLEEPGGYTPWN